MAKEVQYNSDYVDGHMRSLKIEDETLALRVGKDKAKFTGDLAIEGQIDVVKTDSIQSGTDSKMVIESKRGIELDSFTGNFHMLYNNNEFSPNGDAFSGMILGMTKIQNQSTTAGHNEITPNATLTVMQTAQGTDVSITFTAPPSGNVEIVMTCCIYASSKTIEFALSDNSTYNEINQLYTYDVGIQSSDETDINMTHIPWIVTGLTPGTEYTYYIAAAETVSGLSAIRHGVFRTTGTHYPPIVVRAIALPTNMTTGE